MNILLEWNKRLFPVFVTIFLILVLIDSLKLPITQPYQNLFNLNYKLLFVLISGLLVVWEQRISKNPIVSGP